MNDTTTSLGLTVLMKADYEAALARVVDALKVEGFGVLTEIDVKETPKKPAPGWSAWRRPSRSNPAMPVHEFNYSKCGEEFEELVRNAEAIKDVICPACGDKKVKKKVSTFAAIVAGGGSASTSAACNTGGTWGLG